MNKPLKSKMCIKKAGGEWIWISFKYEQFPSFCFYCGRIGRSEKFCVALFDEKEVSGDRKYDGSLRAPMRGQQGSSKNQWLRGADGSKLNTVVEEQGDGGEGWSKSPGTIVTRSHDFWNSQQKSGNQGGSSTTSTIIGEDGREEFRDTGIFISNQKCTRKEINIDGKLELGCITDPSNGMDTDMIDGVDQNQKNLLLAGAATQACHSS